MFQRWNIVNTTINILVPKTAGNFLKSRATLSISRLTVRNGVGELDGWLHNYLS
jgi:hypothetical protein